MHKWWKATCLLVMTAGSALLWGCAATTAPQMQTERISTDTIMKLPVAALDHSGMEWTPGIGRMTPLVRHRHVPAEEAPIVLWNDEFNDGESRLPQEWTAVGRPSIVPFRVGATNGLEISANGESASADCRIERRLDPAQLQGRDIRLSIEMACVSARRLENLRKARISIVSTGSNRGEVSLPLIAELSPGWELIDWWIRFGPQLGPTTLRVDFPKDAGIVVRRMAMTANRSGTGVPTSAPAAMDGRVIRNLIAGGDFETGRRMFFVSRLHSWPQGEPTSAPLLFEYEGQAAVGERCLKLQIPAGRGRVGFGPLALKSPADRAPQAWHLKFFARSTRPVSVTASIRTADHLLDSASFTTGTDWQAFTHEFKLKPDDSTGSAELILDVSAGSEPLECRLDGVSLTDAPSDTYVQAEPIEVGITGPALLTSDLANIVGEDETTVFTLGLAKNPTARPALPGVAAPSAAGKLALDVLDAWDRSVWSRTSEPVIPATGKFNEKISLRLPRGYYRLLATLWSGEPGESAIISHDSSAVAVISFDDPVPLGNRYGLTAANDNVSGYTTALGAGWVRMPISAQQIETSHGRWDFSALQPGLVATKDANVELLASVNLPGNEQYCRSFLEQFLTASPLQPIGLVLNAPTASTRPVADEYRERLESAATVLSTAAPLARIVFDLSAIKGGQTDNSLRLPALPRVVVGYASTAAIVPERSERLLEDIGRRYASEARVWDVGVPVRIGGNAVTANWAAAGTTDHAITLLDPPPDPALSASRMIRSILIRALAGAQLVCSDAVVLDPPRSLSEPALNRLHEWDLSPRPALAAYERMTSLLNSATLVRWIDQPDGCRLLFFERDDGGAVAIAWRPFGLTPTFLSFAGLPSNIEVLDCFGMPEPIVLAGNVRLIAANEMVRYLVAGPGQAAVLAEAIEGSRVRPGPVGE